MRFQHGFPVVALSLLLFASGMVPARCQDAAVATVADQRFQMPESDDGLAGQGPIRRYDWFKNLWQKRRQAFASKAVTQQGGVVFLGDSITQGWQDDFRGTFADLKPANRGISGDTTRGMLIRLQQDVIELDPQCVVILAGTNDLEENASPETIAGNMQLIVSELRAADPQMPIVMCLVFPSHESKKRPAAKIKQLNDLYRGIAKADENTIVVDTWTLFANDDGDAKESEFPDLLHPNAVGYAKWTAALTPVFATLGWIENEADAFELEPGFESLFNGKDLTGWGYRRTSEAMRKAAARWQSRDPNAPAWPVVNEAVGFDGKTQTPDGRYVAINGRLVVTAPREGRKIQQLWTTRDFPDNFELRLEFRAMPNADSGVFVREPQLQCRDYVLAGPYKKLTQYKPQQWNELRVVVNDGVARCTCNDEVIEEAMKVPETGPIGLEGDRGQMEYRRLRIRTLGSTP
ncbi:GDSL-type esterase/lipase family protein [Novipirellula artificiosorum]|uniref:GDSL-like Lipase/Acylhydrolase n=1 Tax=Novipirellula artificiosorum TaxID=2528016 RepID=A0A5C6DMF4_9BACT|nr:GDSL-type esterase/lipase family protein [Novipirellula artificiosorum]TWU37345.1 GDSL-like Lipase/Acylhydrolase [Novipirellula artificiosorum]